MHEICYSKEAKRFQIILFRLLFFQKLNVSNTIEMGGLPISYTLWGLGYFSESLIFLQYNSASISTT